MPLLPTLHELDCNVLAFDFRGHGESPGHTETFGSLEVEDLRAAQAYLTRRCPNKPLFLVGISYGAAVALQALPQMLDVQGVWVEGCFSRLGAVAEQRFSWVPTGLLHGLAPLYYELAWLDCGVWGPAINPIDHLKGLQVPICFCHGTADDLVPFAQAQALFDAYTGPKWHYWVEGATHYNVRQKDNDRYLQRLQDFLEDRLQPGLGSL
jgi:alpha-beta hydrolase superfamily lysophospholipase